VDQSLTTLEPTRNMRLLGLFGFVGAGLLLWAFVPLNPFADPALNGVRLVAFALAGTAISIAFYRRQAEAAPTLTRITTAAVVVAGVSYATWVILSARVDSPFIGTFGFANLVADIALWVSPALWAIAMLHAGAGWRGMPRRLEMVTKLGVWTLVGSIVGWLGDDRLGLIDSTWGELWKAIALAGVAMNGIGWMLLGAVLVVGGRPQLAWAGLAGHSRP
jgi:hypothetical protein